MAGNTPTHPNMIKKEVAAEVLAQMNFARVDGLVLDRKTIEAHVATMNQEISDFENSPLQIRETKHVQNYLAKARTMLQRLQHALSKLPMLLLLCFFALQGCAAQPAPAPIPATQIAIGETTHRTPQHRKPNYDALPSGKLHRRDSAVIAYIRSVAPIAVAMEARHGVPAGFAIAVAIYEGRYGNSPIAQGANNHHGLRYFACGGEFQYIDTQRPYRCKKGRLWRSFATVADSYEAFAKSNAIAILKAENLPYTAENFAGTGYGGHESSRRYAAHLNSILKRYNLEQL